MNVHETKIDLLAYELSQVVGASPKVSLKVKISWGAELAELTINQDLRPSLFSRIVGCIEV